uniref:Cystatin kininogen-type domain-containing protein n=1 Tax=Ornithorhynchus anatinus TaxID=9258 RepID=A0A6I8P0I5_ORNAN
MKLLGVLLFLGSSLLPSRTAPVPQDVDCNDSDVFKAVDRALRWYNEHLKDGNQFLLYRVTEASMTVVSGWNFDVHYTIIQTNCSKQDFEELLPDCKPMPGGDTGDCSDKAFVDPHMKITGFVQNCELFPGAEWIPPPDLMCAGCPQNLPVDSPELKEPLKHSLDKVNSADNYTFYFKVETIRKATFQLVAGQKFSIEFLVRQTRCSKEDNEKMPEDCEVDSNGKVLVCNAMVYMVPWKNEVFPTVTCQDLEMSSFLKRPPGFSPFRSVQTPAKEGSNRRTWTCVRQAEPLKEAEEPEGKGEPS